MDTAQGQLLHAQASEVTARAKLNRYGPLLKAHAVSQQEYDDALATERAAQGDIESAKGQLERAMVDLGYTHMNAPITGRIGRSILTVGALVTANQTNNVAIVTRLDPIYVDVNLPATELLRFRRELAEGRLTRAGDNAASITIALEDGTTYEHTGRMEFSEVNVDEATATVVVRAVMPNPDRLLLPGMCVHAQLAEGTDPNAMLVPQEGVQRNSHGDPQVWVVDADNRVALRPVTVGQAIGTSWLVTGGLKNGERVVVEGVLKNSRRRHGGPGRCRRASGQGRIIPHVTVALLYRPACLCMGDRADHHAGGRGFHLPAAHCAVSLHRAATDRHNGHLSRCVRRYGE
ncbi:efflux RND transporter periplasmic adaptor subunit [Komagataeibacter rhaeticus]|nr:efflux RND transporter periplasmic adaptor subunit [Komagataeibacter rhaeticus]